MNAATNNQQKKIGDRVKITGGQSKDHVGTITAKERRGWIVELEDGSSVTIGFPMVLLIEVTQLNEASEQAAAESEETASVEKVIQSTTDGIVDATPVNDANQETTSSENETGSQTESQIEAGTANDTASEVESPDPEESASEENAATCETDSPTISPEIAKMSVKKLWALAHERGVSVARTKADFLRIIKAMNPDEDLTILKGKALFDRVSELHISRLRSKQEMARLLSA